MSTDYTRPIGPPTEIVSFEEAELNKHTPAPGMPRRVLQIHRDDRRDGKPQYVRFIRVITEWPFAYAAGTSHAVLDPMQATHIAPELQWLADLRLPKPHEGKHRRSDYSLEQIAQMEVAA